MPRNDRIGLNRDPAYFDMGLCGPDRTDLAGHPEYCGLFRTPSLRNVATRRVFFHNGVIHSLRQAVAFYVLRDTRPQMWYPTGPDGRVHPITTCRCATMPISTWTHLSGRSRTTGRFCRMRKSMPLSPSYALLTDGYAAPPASGRRDGRAP
ncbi:hypothetical protein RAA17_11900 [Komagataeibacter rhaeticus]|nr:hypothetical protein [Komagataeibacter rhaeticus]